MKNFGVMPVLGTHAMVPQGAALNEPYVPRIHRNRVGTCCSLTYRVAELHNNHSWANKEVSS